MKIIDKVTLKIFSFIMLIISIVLFMISIQILQESIFGVLISRLFTMVTAGRTILVIVSIVLCLLSVKCLFFTYSRKDRNFEDDVNDEIENDTGILLENDDGRVLITRRTIRSLVNSVIFRTDEIIDAKIIVDINADNEVSVKLAIDVIQGVAIKNVTSKLQSDIKNMVKETTDITIKSVDIDVKEYIDIDSNEDDEDTIDEIDDMETNAKKSKK
jgi:hypothetical protein